MNGSGSLYFHAPCFDGIASAVLAWDYLENIRGWKRISLQPVNYHMKPRWANTDLERPAAIVDFLFHPDAEFWADHHPTTFVDPDWSAKSLQPKPGETFLYDPSSPSCAGLLWRSGLIPNRTSKFEELVRWADKLDSASYVSPAEAVESTAPAAELNLALALGDAASLSSRLVRLLRENTLPEVVGLKEIQTRVRQVRDLSRKGQRLFRASSRLEDGIVVFDVQTGDEIVSRYLPFYVYPEARYSAGIIRQPKSAKLTMMRNPWIDFVCPSLGQLCALYGGGGHQRVGSILLDSASDGTATLSDLISRLRAADDGSLGR